MNHQKTGGKFFNGFFWGAILGGGAAYILSTKRGREAVKELISEGIGRVEDATAPKKESLEKIITPVMEEEIVIEQGITSPSAEERAEAKRRFFKKAAKK